MKKAIFIDVDGTLKNDLKEISLRTLEAIRKVKLKNYEPILCTGRPRDYAEKLNNSISGSNYIIYNNGGGIFDIKTQKVLYERIMNKNSILSLYEIANKDDVRFILASNGTRYVNRVKHDDGSEILIECPMSEFLDGNNIIAVTIASTDFDTIKNMKNQIDRILNIKIMSQHKSLSDPNFERIGTIYYDIVDTNTSKGEAVKYFCKLFNIPVENRIAIGDDSNDIYMFNQCGYKVAMRNALPSVKDIADFITDDNNNDGVAKFLESLIVEDE